VKLAMRIGQRLRSKRY